MKGVVHLKQPLWKNISIKLNRQLTDSLVEILTSNSVGKFMPSLVVRSPCLKIIELMINKLHGLSPSGGLVSPSGGLASLFFDQVEYFYILYIKILCQALWG